MCDLPHAVTLILILVESELWLPEPLQRVVHLSTYHHNGAREHREVPKWITGATHLSCPHSVAAVFLPPDTCKVMTPPLLQVPGLPEA